MTPNELADFLDDNVEAMLNKAQPYIDMAATMLRQQQADLIAAKCLSDLDMKTKIKLQAEIEKLKDEVAEWKMSYENCHRMCNGYGMN